MRQNVLFLAVRPCSLPELQITSQISFLPLTPCLGICVSVTLGQIGLNSGIMAVRIQRHEFEPCLCHLLSVTIGELLYLSEPQFLHL